MNKMKCTVKFTVEAERTLTFRTRCERCGAEVEMATVDEAARAAGVSELTICRGLEADSFHFIEDAAGHLLVCLNTLLR